MPPSKKKNKKLSSGKSYKSNPTAQKQIKSKSNKVFYRNFFIAALIALITWIVMSPSLKNSFTNWDDPAYVYENNDIKSLSADNINHIFSSIIVYNYHPITIISLALDYKYAEKIPGDFFGLDAFVFHRTSVFIHILNTLLVFILFYLLGKKRIEIAVIVALAFGIHPMHVESVSWISERKDVLYGFFFLAGLIAWFYYNEKGARTVWFYVAALFLFVFSVLSKPAAAAFPAVLLLFDYFQKRKFSWKLVLEKIPFFLIAFVIIYITFKAQSGESVGDWAVLTIPQRFMFASYGFIVYIIKFIAPVNLSAFYPYPSTFPVNVPLHWTFYAAPVAVVLIFAMLFYFFRKGWRLPVFAVLFYLFTIALVLQFVSVGKALMAERYSYIPYLGLAFMLAYGVSYILKYNKKNIYFLKIFVLIVLIASFSCIAVSTYARTKVWKNNYTLWTDVIEKFPRKVDVAYKNRGNYFARETKEYDKALKDYNVFLELSPNDPTVYSNRGNLFGLQQKFDLSIADYTKAIALDSTYIDPRVNRAITYMKMNKPGNAIIDFNMALVMKPGDVVYHRNRGYCYIQLGKADSAVADYNYVISKDPSVPDDFFYRGIAYFQKKEYQKAIDDNTKAISMNPEMGGAYYNRSLSYKAAGTYSKALDDALKARQLKQNISDAYINELKKLAK